MLVGEKVQAMTYWGSSQGLVLIVPEDIWRPYFTQGSLDWEVTGHCNRNTVVGFLPMPTCFWGEIVTQLQRNWSYIGLGQECKNHWPSGPSRRRSWDSALWVLLDPVHQVKAQTVLHWCFYYFSVFIFFQQCYSSWKTSANLTGPWFHKPFIFLRLNLQGKQELFYWSFLMIIGR